MTIFSSRAAAVIALLGSLMVALLFGANAAFADSLSVDFESPPYTTGNINGQNGWSKTGPYDVEVVSNTYGFVPFGSQTLRVSNSKTSGSFGDQTFSASLADEVGEIDAVNGGKSGGTRQSHFEAQFDFTSTQSTQQPGLFMSVNPDRGDGARMSYLGFSDNANGIDVNFYDVQGENAGFQTASFVQTVIATGLSRTEVHTAKFVIDFVDGPSNDIVKIYINGNLVHTGTTWENYYRFDTESQGNPVDPNLVNKSRTVDSLLFRTGGAAAPANAGKGFLIDNLSLSSSTPPVVGDLEITKYLCPAGTTINRNANGIGEEDAVPNGCVADAGENFGYVYNPDQNNGDGPWDEFDDPINAEGVTGSNGVLTFADLPVAGRYVVFETNGSGGKRGNNEILGLYCDGDNDPDPNHNDNGDIAVLAAGETTKCVAYNLASCGNSAVEPGEQCDDGNTANDDGCSDTCQIEPPKLSDVKVCKTNENGEILSGWTLILKGAKIEDVLVPTNTSAGINTVASLENGRSYLASASGTYTNQGGANIADAEYSTTDNWATVMDGYTGYGNDILELQINASFDPNSDWGAYNTAHTYLRAFTGTGVAANFRVFDGEGTTPNEGWYGDNSGTLNVSIFEGNMGVTGDDGCVVFEDVVYGKYQLEEVLKAGWHNVSGLGEVEVNEAAETFTVVNAEDVVLPTTAKLTLIKAVSGSEEPVTSWTLTATGPTTFFGTSGIFADVLPGTYVLSETGPAGYTPSDWVCEGAATDNDPNAVTLAAGDVVTCTITNTFIPPVPTHTVTVYKYLDGKLATKGVFDFLWNLVNGFTLGDPAYTETIEVAEGTDFALSEVLSGDTVGNSCRDGKPFALVGYSKGKTEQKAKKADVKSKLNIKGISEDMSVIVWNKSCCDQAAVDALKAQAETLKDEAESLFKQWLRAPKSQKPALFNQWVAKLKELNDTLHDLGKAVKQCKKADYHGGWHHFGRD